MTDFSPYSTILFARPSLLTGLARVLDLGATLRLHSYSASATPVEADIKALASDWLAVSEDLAQASDSLRREIAAR